MQVKKFEAPTMQEALKVIKREMGPDAIILKTKENRKGFGLMSSTSVEVTVAITDRDLKKKSLAEKDLPEDVRESIYERSASQQKEIYDSYFDRQLGGNRGATTRSRQRESGNRDSAPDAVTSSQVQTQIDAGGNARVTAKSVSRYRQIDPSILDSSVEQVAYGSSSNEVVATRSNSSSQRVVSSELGKSELVEDLQSEVSELRSLIKQISREQAVERRSRMSADVVSEEVSQTFRDLVNAGIERPIAKELLEEISIDQESESSNYKEIQERLAYAIMERLQVVDMLEGVGAKNGKAETSFLSIVGPTGVGKTTTIAKIASQASTQRGLRVGLLNLDMYRVAAADQLQTYAKLMNLPYRNVRNVEELNEAIHDFGSLDLVLIDTTGRSQKDAEGLAEISKFLDQIEDLKTMLVVSANTRDSELRDITSRFRLFKPSSLIFSKLDETGVFGGIVNTQLRTELPLAYFTVGQRVPEDIERATKERVVDLVVDL